MKRTDGRTDGRTMDGYGGGWRDGWMMFDGLEKEVVVVKPEL